LRCRFRKSTANSAANSISEPRRIWNTAQRQRGRQQ
jgi:hypothetical protein